MRRKQVSTSGMEWNAMIGLTERLKKDKQYRDYMLIVAGCYFGLRVSDLLKLRWKDVLSTSEICLIEQKTKKKRSITVNAAVHNAANFCLKQQREIRGQSLFLGSAEVKQIIFQV